MKLEIPEPLRLREEAICSALRLARESGGETGDAAALLEAILLPHLAKEKTDVLQPLGLLAPLARGGFSPEMAEVLPQIDQLKNDLHGLRVEHAAILSAIKRLVAAAREEGKPKHARFAERLLFRAWLDEAVFHPLAILIGNYLRLCLTNKGAASGKRQLSPREPVKLSLPEPLQFSHAQLKAALSETLQAGGQTMIAAEAVAQLFEPHLRKESGEVLRILGLLEPLARDAIEVAEDSSELNDLEANESSLHQEHAALIVAVEKLRTAAREEGADAVLEFAERLLMRIRLDEEIFYPAAILIRNYLRLKRRNRRGEDVSSPKGSR